MKDQYVLLTGTKNNAGDYLIKYRALQLLAELRPDRKIITYDSWKPFTPQQLEEVNSSRALILMGGPALHPDMRPVVYPMTPNLEDIKVPIITMGIGWKSREGSWEASNKYKLGKETLQLLERIERSGHMSSVRDYHTLNVLVRNKFRNFLMTGCPALYSLDHVGRPFTPPVEVKNISFSLGVSFADSDSMDRAMKENIEALSTLFRDQNFTVVFHHSLSTDSYREMKGHDKFLEKHLEFRDWLDSKHIKWKDISGSAENLVEHYRNCDLHIGYRVHAHIFMCSESRPSVLLNEDGRGKALANVISGFTLDSYKLEESLPRLPVKGGALTKLMNYLYLKTVPAVKGGKMTSSLFLTDNLVQNLGYEMSTNWPRVSLTRKNIDSHLDIMKNFISQLP